MRKPFTLTALTLLSLGLSAADGGWVRLNQLGYLPQASKVAVYMSEEATPIDSFTIEDAFTGEQAYASRPEDIRPTGGMGGMQATYRLNFSALTTAGAYRLCIGGTKSDIFPIGNEVYDGTADFVLNYMRQQRCGWNPFFRDSCHRKDAIIVGHPTKDGQRLDVRGGWHDASDCLQYTTTSANAIYQMMFAWLQNPSAFGDAHKADGTSGANGIPDIIDEIHWGLDWLDRMNPEVGEMYNQIADDRDHVGMRIPKDDQADYGWGKGQERPVWFCSGKPQQRGRHGGVNDTEGIASTAGKFASDFALGSEILRPFYPEFAAKIGAKAAAAYQAGLDKPGKCQTASVVSPYIYEEDNWVDDMELGAFELYRMTGEEHYRDEAAAFGRQELVTPWMGADTARHYQWYPFMNMGHYQLAAGGTPAQRAEFVRNLRLGIQRIYERGKDDPFMYGIPSIWCSNNLTTAMLTQCILYRQLTGDETYAEMEGSLRDWLLGCNPWGVSMIVELPRGGTYPTQPHSFIINYKLGNTTGGLVDGPVYETIFGSLLGINTEGGINYEEFQPGNKVYHDSTHDYSTNEPTMDGTASLTFPLSAYEMEGRMAARAAEAPSGADGGTANGSVGTADDLLRGAGDPDRNVYAHGGIVRTDPSKKRLSLVFTAADRNDGADKIISALRKEKVKGAFFFTGEFFEKFPETVDRLISEGHYVGSHSYAHLLYCSWADRDSMLVTKEVFFSDMIRSYAQLAGHGISKADAPWFIPPYEHYNAVVSSWARQLGLQVVNLTGGVLTNGDYTTPDMEHYYSSDEIMERVFAHEKADPQGLNGQIMLIHLGTDPARTDKFYDRLPELLRKLRRRGYDIVPLPEAIRE